MTIKNLKTNKLFYKKWVYKVECYKLQELRQSIGYEKLLLSSSTANKTPYLIKFRFLLDKFINKDVQIRNEGHFCSIFCNDESLLEKIIRDLNTYILTVHRPNSQKEFDFLLANGTKKIVCDRYPKNIYQYKIYIKINMKLETRRLFLEWLNRYDQSKLNVSRISEQWLQGSVFWTQNPFLYVSDGAMLSLVSMYLGDNLKKIEEYILRSSINT